MGDDNFCLGGIFMLFITGIAGHSGKWFLQRLEKEGYQGKIRGLVRSGDTAFVKNLNLDIECVPGDLSNLDELVEAVQGADIILHIATIMKTENVIEAAIRNKVKWVICVHTTGRFSKYKSASSEYIQIEDAVLKRRNEIDITIVRPTMIYGSSGDRNMYRLVDYLYRNKFFPMFGNGKNLMQPVHARDLGNAYYDILMNSEKTKNKEYDLSGAQPLPYIEVVRTVSRELNRKTTIVRFPIWFSVLSAKMYALISKKPKIKVEQVLRMQEDKAFGYESAARDFGYDPVSFEEGIREEIKEYLQKTS